MNEQAISLQEIENGIIKLVMQDRINKNTFSSELMNGLINAFNFIENDTSCKVVILTGYDCYFASGGTRESLLTLHETKASFSDINIYSLPLDCPVPVISAMQGHGIGGGFVMGLFSDIILLSKESFYTTNFMKYGFTPGMGATCILPEKIGLSLSQEMLFSATNYRGEELQKRGIPFPVLPRKEVLPYAINLAKELADKPRHSLVTLKEHLTANLKEKLPIFIEQEVKMHEKTIHQKEVKERILKHFGE